MSAEFLITALIIVATPGTGVLFTLSAALSRGARAGLVAAAGCTLGIVPHMVAAITGLAAVLHASALAFDVLKYVGVAYLLYLAWTTWRDDGLLVAQPSTAPPSAVRVVASGILVNVLNPKLTIFFFAFLPLFVPASEVDAVVRMAELSAAFMLVTLVVFAAYALVAAAVRTKIVARPGLVAWLRRCFAAAYVALAARLAVTSR